MSRKPNYEVKKSKRLEVKIYKISKMKMDEHKNIRNEIKSDE